MKRDYSIPSLVYLLRYELRDGLGLMILGPRLRAPSPPKPRRPTPQKNPTQTRSQTRTAGPRSQQTRRKMKTLPEIPAVNIPNPTDAKNEKARRVAPHNKPWLDFFSQGAMNGNQNN